MSAGMGNADSSALLQERIDCAKRLLPEIVLSVKEGEEKILTLNHGYGYYHFGRGINVRYSFTTFVLFNGFYKLLSGWIRKIS